MRKSILLVLITIHAVVSQSQHVQFVWPLKQMPGYSEVTDYYCINNYVDQDATAGIKDWACNTGSGASTYNGHQGLDIDLWPFHWSMMDNNYVAVVAAADGWVVDVDMNNNNEDNCPGNLLGSWNRIVIRHNDSSTTIYGHLRNNSAMVAIGQRVTQGQPLAFVGSSGNSSHPHLHFEVNSGRVTDGINTGLAPIPNGVVEPYYTSGCNTLTNSSWWLNQKSYKEPGIVRVMTHYGVPSVLDATNNNFCRSTEDKKAKNNFNPGEQVFIGVALRNISAAQNYFITVYKPDGSILLFLPLFTPDNYKKWYSTNSLQLPANAPAGTYKIEVNYQSTTGTHFFSVGCTPDVNTSVTVSGNEAFIAGNNLYSANRANNGSRLRLQAGQTIWLQNGFRALQGCSFKARIKDCNYSE